MYEGVDEEIPDTKEESSGASTEKKEIPPPNDETSSSAIELPKPKAKKVTPELPAIERRNWLINFHFLRKEFDTCKALIEEQLIDSKGNCEYALLIKGTLLRYNGKLQESLEAFQACLQINPKNTNCVKQIARNLFLLGRHKSALETFEQAIKEDPHDWELYYWLGVCFYHMKENTRAKDSLKHSVDISKRECSLALLGTIFADEGDYMNAVDFYRKALEFSPENPDLLTSLGLLYIKLNSYQQAFEVLGRALGFDATHSGAILAAGGMMQQYGDLDVALSKYRVAAQSWPDSPQLWNNIAMCFYGKKKFVAAVSCLKRANYLAPFDWKILYNLGLVHLSMKQFASAFHFLSSAINLQPKVSQLYTALAASLTNLEDFKNARQAYEHAAKMDSKDPILALNYAIFLQKSGEQMEAQTWFDRYEQRIKEWKTNSGKPEPEMIELADKLKSILNPGWKASPAIAEKSPVVAEKPLASLTDDISSDGDRGKSAEPSLLTHESDEVAI